MNEIELTKEEMEFILDYREAGKEDKEKVKRVLDGDVDCLNEEKSVIL